MAQPCVRGRVGPPSSCVADVGQVAVLPCASVFLLKSGHLLKTC